MNLWERKFAQAMRRGKLYDKMSDRAFKNGDQTNGARFGALAMKAYTEAEGFALNDEETG